MAEYVPTTEEVRRRFVDAYGSAYADAAFNRWLEALKRAEREAAWNEGYSAGFTDGDAGGRWADDDNPYRIERGQ